MFNFVIDLVKKNTRPDIVSMHYSIDTSKFMHFMEACHAFGIEHIKVTAFDPIHSDGFLHVKVEVPVEYYVRFDRMVTDNPVDGINLSELDSF